MKVIDKMEDDEFMRVKRVWTSREDGVTPFSTCSICGDLMDLQKTQKIMFVNNVPCMCCMRHTAREMTDYIKANERGTK